MATKDKKSKTKGEAKLGEAPSEVVIIPIVNSLQQTALTETGYFSSNKNFLEQISPCKLIFIRFLDFFESLWTLNMWTLGP